MEIHEVTVANASEYADLIVVCYGERHRVSMLSAWMAQATTEAAEATGGAPDPYSVRSMRRVPEHEWGDATGLLENEQEVTYDGLALQGPGVTLRRSGLNG